MTRNEIIGILSQYKNENQNKYKILKIGFFGSAAREQMNEQSDIDIVVELEKQDLFSIIGIKQDLEEKYGYCVDVVSYRERMNEFLKKRIDGEAVYV
jgi:predicted nucleotidyltransferase